MANNLEQYLKPGEQIEFRTQRRRLPRGWDAGLTAVLALVLGRHLADLGTNASSVEWSSGDEPLFVLAIILLFRLGRHIADRRTLALVTEGRLLHVGQGVFSGWSNPEITEIPLSHIDSVRVHPSQMVVEARGNRLIGLVVPAQAEALAQIVVRGRSAKAVIPSRLEAIARFTAINLPIFIGLVALLPLMDWMLVAVQESETMSRLLSAVQLQPGEFRRTVIALAVGIPVLMVGILTSLALMSIVLYVTVLVFAPHVDRRRAVEVFPLTPDSQLRADGNRPAGWMDGIARWIVGTVYGRQEAA